MESYCKCENRAPLVYLLILVFPVGGCFFAFSGIRGVFVFLDSIDRQPDSLSFLNLFSLSVG